MEEEKQKNVDVNNSDPSFVTGVLYGMMFSIEVVLSAQLPVTKDKNIIVSLINDTLAHCGWKINEMFKMVKENNRVPDLMGVLKSAQVADEKMGLTKGLRKSVDDILDTLKSGGSNEN